MTNRNVCVLAGRWELPITKSNLWSVMNLCSLQSRVLITVGLWGMLCRTGFALTLSWDLSVPVVPSAGSHFGLLAQLSGCCRSPRGLPLALCPPALNSRHLEDEASMLGVRLGQDRRELIGKTQQRSIQTAILL